MNATTSQFQRRSILVVDDDAQLRRFIVELLEGEGFVVIQAPDGETGVKLFREHGPDLILTDIVMPDGEGIELIQTIGASTQRRPIVAMSGGGALKFGADYLRMARLLGADAALQKPFTGTQLLQTVDGLLKTHCAEDRSKV